MKRLSFPPTRAAVLGCGSLSRDLHHRPHRPAQLQFTKWVSSKSC